MSVALCQTGSTTSRRPIFYPQYPTFVCAVALYLTGPLLQKIMLMRRVMASSAVELCHAFDKLKHTKSAATARSFSILRA
jgi:hypothetical protein